MPLRFASLLLAAGPLAMLVVFGILRDIPPDITCGDRTPVAVVDAYRTGLWWIAGAAELVAATVLVAALRADDGALWRVRVSVAVTALASGNVVFAVVLDRATSGFPWASAALASAATALAVWAALTRLSGARPTRPVLLGAAAAAWPAAVAGGFATLLAFLLSLFVAVAALPLALMGAAWLWTAQARAADAVVVATLTAVAVVPAGATTIWWLGEGPLIC